MRSEACSFLGRDRLVDPKILYLLQHEARLAEPKSVSVRQVRHQNTHATQLGVALAIPTQTRNRRRWRRHFIAEVRGSPEERGVHSLISGNLVL